RRSAQTDRRAPGAAGPARTAPGFRVRHHPLTNAPARDPLTYGGDAPSPFMAEDRVGSRVALEHEMQIGPADPAVRHLDQDRAGIHGRNRHPAHVHLSARDVYRGEHLVPRHADIVRTAPRSTAGPP